LERRRDQTRDHEGGGRDGRALKLGMPFAWYAGMNDADLDAIVARLRQVPPLE
jgi:hypothetical protein